MNYQFIRLPGVLSATGNGRTKQYQDIRDGLFTKPVAIGTRARAWPVYEVEAINAARVAGKTDDEVRELVAQLEAARKAAHRPGGAT